MNGLVTVTRVQMPADFRTAKVYVSFFSSNETEVDFLKVLKKWAVDIQGEIDHKLKMRYCPKLTFYEDESTESILKIERIISEISKNKSETDTESSEGED